MTLVSIFQYHGLWFYLGTLTCIPLRCHSKRALTCWDKSSSLAFQHRKFIIWIFKKHRLPDGHNWNVSNTCAISNLWANAGHYNRYRHRFDSGRKVLLWTNRKRASRIDVSLTYKSAQEKRGLPPTSALVPSSLACQRGRLSVNWSAAEHFHLSHYVGDCTRRFLNCWGYWGASRWRREGLVSCLRVRFCLNPAFVAHVCM